MKQKNEDKIWVDIQGDLYQFDPPEDNWLMEKKVIYQEVRLPKYKDELAIYFEKSIILEL